MFVPLGLGHQHRDVAADDFIVCISENPLGGRVHRFDDTGFVDGDDAVNGGVDDRLQPDGRLADGFFGLFSLGDVARDLGETSQLVLFVEDRSDHAAGEEAAAVLALMPALVGRAALGGGGGDLALGHAGGAVLGREQDRQVLPKDLLFGITEEPFGAGVPAHDPALGIDGENGEILDALDHEPQILLGLAQRLLDTFRWAISCSSSRLRASCSRATIRDSASSRSVRA